MQTYLISKELDNLLFMDVINEDFREKSKLITILISSITQQSPLLEMYEEKKKLGEFKKMYSFLTGFDLQEL
jgi:hypothetical protein